MISAQNHLQRLSGNRLVIICLFGVLIASCSPKIQPRPGQSAPEAEAPRKTDDVPQPKFTEATISLLLPFRLNEINARAASKSQIDRAAMAIDFYQGFQLGLDSAASSGLNFKLDVFDSQDNPAKLDNLLKRGALLKSNLIVGPAFPDGLKYLRNYSVEHKISVVSPLAASHPAEFNNPNLISVVNNIDLHAQKIGTHITRSYKTENSVVVLINPKGGTDEVFASPLRKYFQNAKNNKLPFQEFASVYALETKLVKGKKYIVLIASYNRKFVGETIDKLLKMQRAGLDVDLYGHPNWTKQTYTAEKLQRLNTIVSSSYHVNYKSPAVIAFVRKYRNAYNYEPGEYSFKGYDVGFYFGKQLASHGPDYLKYLTREKYKGLHNAMAYVHDDATGYINTSLMLLQYKNFALNVIE
jgi:ABC-type branched-subunit amino acid transport system substrate-binding protein